MNVARARELLEHAQRARCAKLEHLRHVLVSADELESLTQELIDRRTSDALDAAMQHELTFAGGRK
jgi:hypothetical protein